MGTGGRRHLLEALQRVGERLGEATRLAWLPSPDKADLILACFHLLNAAGELWLAACRWAWEEAERDNS